MGMASFLQGNAVKFLKSVLLASDGQEIIFQSADPSSSATDGNAGDVCISSSAKQIFIKQDSGSNTNWSQVGGGSTAVVSLQKFTKTYADFSDASSSKYITLTTLAANQNITRAFFHWTTAFSGGSISDYQVAIVLDGIGAIIPLSSVKSSPTRQYAPAAAYGDNNGGLGILARGVTIGDNLDQATQGSVDIWIEVVTLT